MTGTSCGKAIAYAVALFLAGAICGAMVMTRITPPVQSLKIGRTDEIAVKIQEKLKTGLGLAPEQLEKFKPLVAKAATELESSHRDCLDRISAALDTLHTQIMPDLNPDQKQKMALLESQRTDQMVQKYNYQPGATNQSRH